MRFDVITIFPKMFRGAFSDGVIARAIANGHIQFRLHNLRQYADDKRGTVDDTPYGGGGGMILKPEPLFRAVRAITEKSPGSDYERERIILLSPSGKLFHQQMIEELANYDRLVLICGRYEGVDERVREFLADEELSIGDYVLSGGELAALVVIDAISRALPNVLGNEESFHQDSFQNGLLDFPQYTKPADFSGKKVPEVLQSGHHQKIEEWRHQKAQEKTARMRPDLWMKKKSTVV